MKKSLITLILPAIVINLKCHGEMNSQKIDSSVSKKYPNHIYLGPEAFAFNLHTHVKDVKIGGLRYFLGARLRYEYLKPKAFYAGVDFLWSRGNKEFKPKSTHPGYYFRGNGAGIGFGNLELRMGYTFAPKNGMLTPFLGMGFYGFGNTNSNDILVYVAAGMRSLFELNRWFSLGLNLKAFSAPEAEWEFKYRNGGHLVRLREYNNMWGGEIGVPFVWYLGSTRRWEIQLEPYFLKLDFSEVQNIYGTRLLFGYRF